MLALGACYGSALRGHKGRGSGSEAHTRRVVGLWLGCRAGGAHTQDGGIRDVGGGEEAYELRRSGACWLGADVMLEAACRFPGAAGKD